MSITWCRQSLSTSASSGAMLPLVHHHVAQRPAGFGLVGLRRGVVDLDRLLDDRQLLLRQAEHAGDLFRRRRAAELFGQPRGGPPPLREQLDHVRRDADRLAGVDQCPLDRLLDPVAGVGAEPRAHRRVETFDGPQQAEVAFFDEVLQAEAFARVAAGDVHDEPQVGADHAVAGRACRPGRCCVASSFSSSRVEQRRFVDLAEIGFQRRLNGECASCAFRVVEVAIVGLDRSGGIWMEGGQPGAVERRRRRFHCRRSRAHCS